MKKVIDAKAQTAYERWELPSVRGGEPGGIQDLVQTGAPVTVSHIERWQRHAYEEGVAEGREAGFAKGYEEGLSAAQAESRARVDHLESVLQTLTAPLESLDEEVVESLVDLSVAIARQLVRRELKTDPGQVIAAVREAVSALPVSSRSMRVHLHPKDAATVRDALALKGNEVPWELLEDPTLTLGGCRVETDTSRVDATVEGRFAAVVADVLGGERDED